jgi:hypothetical protein
VGRDRATSVESGLQPFLLSGLRGSTERPWDSGKSDGEPEDTSAIDGMDAAQLLDHWWPGPSEEQLVEDEEWREMFAPFGEQFPGPAPSVEEELDAELMRRAVFQYTRDARSRWKTGWSPGQPRTPRCALSVKPPCKRSVPTSRTLSASCSVERKTPTAQQTSSGLPADQAAAALVVLTDGRRVSVINAPVGRASPARCPRRPGSGRRQGSAR